MWVDGFPPVSAPCGRTTWRTTTAQTHATTSSCRCWTRCLGPRGGDFLLCWAGLRARNFFDDLSGRGLTHRAARVVDPTLRERESASAGALLFIELAQHRELPFRGEFGKVHARQLGGAFGVGEKDLTGVLEGLDLGLDGKSQQGTNLRLVEGRIAQANVLLHHAPVRVRHERSGQT